MEWAVPAVVALCVPILAAVLVFELVQFRKYRTEAIETVKGQADTIDALRGQLEQYRDKDKVTGSRCNLCGGPTCKGCKAYFTAIRDDGFCSDECKGNGEMKDQSLGVFG